jgi:hypothetical protein
MDKVTELEEALINKSITIVKGMGNRYGQPITAAEEKIIEDTIELIRVKHSLNYV